MIRKIIFKMSLIELKKPDDKNQIIYNNYKFSRTSNKSKSGSKDFRCCDP